MNFNVTLSTPATKAIRVAYSTANITASSATAGTFSSSADYVPASGTLIFNAGETSKNIAIKIYGDATKESNETFSLTLSSPTSHYTLLTSKATGTILNDD